MTSLRLPTDLEKRYGQLADDLDGFDGGADLARYVLDATADELRREETGGTGAEADAEPSRADDGVVEDRLEQLGYLEK